ncbi:MAG: hypothetical protein JSV56_04575 [Methanomassiliicoccales archaeon]|nr:MAG: hypothetical protein JSV56_04575 [Methanomassiliicoccales archaeon]
MSNEGHDLSEFPNYYGDKEPQGASLEIDPSAFPKDVEKVDLDKLKIAKKYRQLIHNGWDGNNNGEYPSNSELVMAVASHLRKRGCEFETFYSICLDVNLRMSRLLMTKHGGNLDNWLWRTWSKVDEQENPASGDTEERPGEGADISERLQFPEHLMSGVAGDFVDLYSGYIEPPKVFLFFGFLTCFGQAVVDKLTMASEIKPRPRFYMLCLGESAEARKSTGIDAPVDYWREFMEHNLNCSFGVGSAEGLQDKIEATLGGKLLLVLDEFKAFVNKCKIEAPVLLPCVNTLFEKTRYETRTKNKAIEIDNAQLSILAASTIQTYQTMWTSTFIDIGFTNRLFLVPGKGKRQYPIPATIPLKDKKFLADKIKNRIAKVNSGLEMKVDPQALNLFTDWYLEMQESVHTKRIDTYALRLMPLLALNDLKTEVDLDIVQRVTEIMDWQIKVREQLDPIDADNIVAKLEEKIRRGLQLGPLKDRDLKRLTNAKRAGLWAYEKAVNNLQSGKSPEIKYDGKKKIWEIVVKSVVK